MATNDKDTEVVIKLALELEDSGLDELETKVAASAAKAKTAATAMTESFSDVKDGILGIGSAVDAVTLDRLNDDLAKFGRVAVVNADGVIVAFERVARSVDSARGASEKAAGAAGELAEAKNKLREASDKLQEASKKEARKEKHLSKMYVNIAAKAKDAWHAVSKLFDSYLGQAKADAQLTQSIRNNTDAYTRQGLSVSELAAKLKAFAQARQEATGIGDESTMGLQQMILATGELPANLDRLVTLFQDIEAGGRYRGTRYTWIQYRGIPAFFPL